MLWGFFFFFQSVSVPTLYCIQYNEGPRDKCPTSVWQPWPSRHRHHKISSLSLCAIHPLAIISLQTNAHKPSSIRFTDPRISKMYLPYILYIALFEILNRSGRNDPRSNETQYVLYYFYMGVQRAKCPIKPLSPYNWRENVQPRHVFTLSNPHSPRQGHPLSNDNMGNKI